MARWQSWGRVPGEPQRGEPLAWRSDALPGGELPVLPYGNGRSYGDSCLNSAGRLLGTRGLNHLISLDSRSGVLRAEAGVLLAELLQVIVPQGWFLPVTPGTGLATLGGAVANDVHGKNHHHAGSIGCHVRAFDILRSDGSRTVCSAEQNSELFKASIGGLGLTGLISWVELQLIPISSAQMGVETLGFSGLAEFQQLSAESEADYQYSVAWLDCVAQGARLGRGVLFRANHQTGGGPVAYTPPSSKLAMPLDLPAWVLNKTTVSLFNAAYYHAHRRMSRPGQQKSQALDAYFYPLDGIRDWNRMYGRQGFYQYQCVVPPEASAAMGDIVAAIASSGQASFLAVLKEFGGRLSPGMLSFPRKGLCLALDFPNRGRDTLKLFDSLDAIVREAGGALYPAKDGRMPADMFQASFPRLDEFSAHIDPQFSSDFWRRVNA